MNALISASKSAKDAKFGLKFTAYLTQLKQFSNLAYHFHTPRYGSVIVRKRFKLILHILYLSQAHLHNWEISEIQHLIASTFIIFFSDFPP